MSTSFTIDFSFIMLVVYRIYAAVNLMKLSFYRLYPILKEMKEERLPIKKADHKFTSTDYSSWPDDECWELIDGAAYTMSSAPTSTHQSL